jgi:hypothetical protein
VNITRDQRVNEIPADVLNVLVFVEELRKYGNMKKSQLEEFIPVYVLEKFPNSS